MTTIEKMAETLLIGLDAINPETSPKTHALVSKAIDDYQAGKFLFEKTQAYHERGTVAPSCVGCPTAEAMIKRDMVMVRRDRLEEVLRGIVHRPCELKAGWMIEDWKTYLTETEE